MRARQNEALDLVKGARASSEPTLSNRSWRKKYNTNRPPSKHQRKQLSRSVIGQAVLAAMQEASNA